MEGLSIANVFSVLATLLAIIAFFKKNTKDQSDTDKNQDIAITKIESEQAALRERVSKIEGTQDAMNGKLYKEVEKLERKITGLESALRGDMKTLTEAVLSALK